MKNRAIFNLLLIIFPVSLLAQSSYNDYTSNDKKNIFYDDFSTNDYNWPIGTFENCRTYTFKPGYYELKSTCKSVVSVYFNNAGSFKINENEDFELEISMMFISGEENNANSIGWGKDNSNENKFKFGFSANGYFIFNKYYNDAWIDIKPWTTSDVIKKNDYNILTVRKVGDKYYFFINKVYVHSCAFEPFFGQRVDFSGNQNSVVRVDYIRISSLNKKNSSDYQLTGNISKKGGAASPTDFGGYSDSDREKIFTEDFSTNNYSWPVGTFDDCRTYTYYRGYYEIKSTCKTSSAIVNFNKNKGFNIDQSRDFEIETSMMYVSGTDNKFYGIAWGKNETIDERFNFGFSANGYFLINKYKNYEWHDFKPWTLSSLVKKNDYNKLTIRKIDNTYYFFLNNVFVYSCPFEPFFGQRLDFTADMGTELRIKYINISYLGKQKDNQPIIAQKVDNFEVNLPPILTIQDIALSKNLLNAGESAQLSITLKNIGEGDANNVYVNLSGDLAGLTFPSKTNFPNIAKSGGVQTINIPITSGIDLPTAQALLKIEVVEPNFKVKIQGKQVKFPTREFLKPELLLAKFAVVENLSANPNNQIDINEQIDVKFAVQNVGQGNAEDVNVVVTNNQPGVMLLGFVDNTGKLIRRNPTYGEIASGKYETVTYRYFVNSEFTSNQLVFNIKANEKINRYGFAQDKSVEINKTLQEEGYIRTVSNTTESKISGKVVIEDIPDFVSDVDQNIPVNNALNDKTFAVIIGNEAYTREIKVNYALNDARIFKQYLQKSLGLPTNNIHYMENATFGEILDGMKWINDVIKAYNGQAKVIFYYAGHGMPDEQTKSAYMLPVDGNSQNPATAVKLADIYSKLTEYPSQSVTVFLDACFSGASRESAGTMLASGRGVKIKPVNELLKGKLVVFSAATGDETAFPYSEKQHGLFTYFLLKKLQETKGGATLNDLSSYVITNVTQQSVVVNKKSQTPQVNTSTEVQASWQTFKLK